MSTTTTPPEPTTEALLKLRVWLAGIRDNRAQSEHHRSLTRAACRLLDLRGGLQARNLRQGVDESVADVLDVLTSAGLAPPA
jgi:hypothetical protein